MPILCLVPIKIPKKVLIEAPLLYTSSCGGYGKVVLKQKTEMQKSIKIPKRVKGMVEINERRGLESKISSGWIFSHKLKKNYCTVFPCLLKNLKKDAKVKREKDGAK
jgi:hypothetical protein